MVKLFDYFYLDYKITCEQNSTKTFDFKTLPVDDSKIPTTLIVGDLGLNYATSLKQIERDAKENIVDCILHLGDIGYDMYIGGGAVGNEVSVYSIISDILI